MLAENLVHPPALCKSSNLCSTQEQPNINQKGNDQADQKASESDTGNWVKWVKLFLFGWFCYFCTLGLFLVILLMLGSQSNLPAADEDYDVQSGDESVSLLLSSVCYLVILWF